MWRPVCVWMMPHHPSSLCSVRVHQHLHGVHKAYSYLHEVLCASAFLTKSTHLCCRCVTRRWLPNNSTRHVFHSCRRHPLHNPQHLQFLACRHQAHPLCHLHRGRLHHGHHPPVRPHLQRRRRVRGRAQALRAPTCIGGISRPEQLVA